MKKTEPFKIAITGGKGGTGKSTFTIFFAQKLISEGKKVLIVDLDVDCPNDYLLMQKKLEKAEKAVFHSFPEIDVKKCTQCGLCIDHCKKNALFKIKDKAPTLIKENCLSCFLCQEVCPANAISEKKEQIGQIFKNTINENLLLITGQSKIGLKESIGIIHEAKKLAEKIAKEDNFDVILFDLSAGTHCNVIAGLLNIDLAYAVTEPTPLGANDLVLILEVLNTLKIKRKIVLNKSDLGNKKLITSVVNIDIEMPYLKDIEEKYINGNLMSFSKNILKYTENHE